MSKRVKVVAMALVGVSSTLTMPALMAQQVLPPITVPGQTWPTCSGGAILDRERGVYTYITGVCGDYGGGNQSFPESEASFGSSSSQTMTDARTLARQIEAILAGVPKLCVNAAETQARYLVRANDACMKHVDDNLPGGLGFFFNSKRLAAETACNARRAQNVEDFIDAGNKC